MPVASTKVAWTIGGGVLSGTTTTDADGRFYIYINSIALDDTFEELTVTVNKTTSSIEHKYSCDGIPCTSQTKLIRQLSFDHEIVFRDTSTLPFVGHVYVSGTSTSAGLPHGCPLPSAFVCLYDKIFSNSVGCGLTDMNGEYQIAVPAGLYVYVQVQYGSNHTFEMLTHQSSRQRSGFVDSTDRLGMRQKYDYYHVDFTDAPGLSVDFADTTSRALTLDVSGGKCNRTLGTSAVEMTFPFCSGSWSKTFTFSGRTMDVSVPAHKAELTLLQVTSSGSTNIGTTVTDYMTATNQKQQSVDLESEPASVRWEYHPKPSLEASLSAASSSSCSEIVVPTGSSTRVNVLIKELFWDSIPACSWVEGQVHVVSDLGKVNEEEKSTLATEQLALLEKCSGSGCDLEIDLASDDGSATYFGASAAVDIGIGHPELYATTLGVKYARLLTVSMNTNGYTSLVELAVIIVGSVITKRLQVMVCISAFANSLGSNSVI